MNIKPGDSLPELVFKDLHNQQEVRFSGNDDQALLFVFWGADLPEKKQRATKILNNIQESLNFYQNRNIRVVSVNIQNNPTLVINEILQNAETTFMACTDPKNYAFNELGAFIMPSILFVTRDGKIAAGIGYSRRLSEILAGKIQVLLNEKTKEQVHNELYPEMTHKTPERNKAETQFNYGMSLVQRNRSEAAAEIFHKAIAADHEFGPPYIELGCILVELGDIETAENMLFRGMDLIPDSTNGKVCMIKLNELVKSRI
ncbi:MAG: redoxin domain-containing protein [Proteobacteria bacterium]|nr:redoxin domain-containing protein [Pseudomonadota bacterium]MBU1710701.1 redoxin domain-containing protein [Pseudomonadota bacterium]